MNYPNLVMDHSPVFLNLTFKLNWITDAELRDLLFRRYYFYEMVYPDERSMALALQTKADFLCEYYNKLYETTRYKYNPIENYSMTETSEEDVNDSGNSKAGGSADALQFPMDSNEARPVQRNETQSDASSTNNRKAKRTLKRSGNIGVTTSQQMIQSERELILNICESYAAEFRDMFMLCI